MRNSLFSYFGIKKSISPGTLQTDIPDETRAKVFFYFNLIFGLSTRARPTRPGVHRQPQAGSTLLLQIQTGTFGDPPIPSASNLTLALDQY